MDLLNLIVNPKKIKSTCFLCYREAIDNTLYVYDDIEIQEELYVSTMSLWKITKYLFPSYDILLSHACQDCTDLVLKMYLTLKRSSLKSELLHKMIGNISKEVNAKTSLDNQESEITIKLAEHDEKNTFNFNIDYVNNCKYCKMRFETKELLQKHVKITHKNSYEAVICDKCGKYCKNPSTLRTHLHCHEQKQCPYCFKMLRSHSHFEIHILSHTKNVRRKRNRIYYNCNDCMYRSVSKSSLESHINKNHLNTRPYVCSVCSKGFFKKSNLTEHILTHNEAKNNICESCGENFANIKTLNVHLRLHFEDKLFKCDICNHRFVTNSRKNEHIKRTHMEKSECCVICNKKYSLKKDLNNHIKKTHKDCVKFLPAVGPDIEPCFSDFIPTEKMCVQGT